MLKLLRMDLLLNWRPLAFTYVLWSAMWLGMPAMTSDGSLTFGFWSGMVSVACAFLPIILVGREDKFKAGALACSLPVTRGVIIRSRYVGGWIVALAAVAGSAAAMGALALVGIQPVLPPTPMLPVIVLAAIGITLALMMPLVLRFGITGMIGFLVAAQLLGVVVMLASVMFQMQAVQVVESAIKNVVRAGRQLHETLGSAAFSAVLLSAVAALNVASYTLSAWLYRRRDF